MRPLRGDTGRAAPAQQGRLPAWPPKRPPPGGRRPPGGAAEVPGASDPRTAAAGCGARSRPPRSRLRAPAAGAPFPRARGVLWDGRASGRPVVVRPPGLTHRLEMSRPAASALARAAGGAAVPLRASCEARAGGLKLRLDDSAGLTEFP